MSETADAIRLEGVDVVHGPDQAAARAMLERGASHDDLRAAGYVWAVEGADLAVRRGEVFVLMGESGCGKSSLLRAVNGLAPLTRGRVLVDGGAGGVDVGDCDPGTLRELRMRHVAMVFQHFALMPWRTVRHNVGLGLELRRAPRAEREARIDAALALVGLDDWAAAYPHELSGGMQQRVGLARAYVTDADILLMDEPFSALDPPTRLRLQEELLDLQRRLRRTILFVTHDVAEALKMGTRVGILESGRVRQVGSPEDIALRPASAYVRQFVAGLNPLAVLRAASIMRPLSAIPDGRVAVDGLVIALDAGGRPHPGPVRTIAAETLLGDVIDARVDSGLPLLVVAADGTLAGVVDEADIVRALAGR